MIPRRYSNAQLYLLLSQATCTILAAFVFHRYKLAAAVCRDASAQTDIDGSTVLSKFDRTSGPENISSDALLEGAIAEIASLKDQNKVTDMHLYNLICDKVIIHDVIHIPIIIEFCVHNVHIYRHLKINYPKREPSER